MQHRRSPLITVTRGSFGSTAGQVLELVHRCGTARREEIAAGTGLSTATVGRAVTALVAARLLRERPDRILAGAVGRPGTPVEIDAGHYAVLGLHLGRRQDTVALGDLTGRVITHRSLPRAAEYRPDLPALARAASDLLTEQPGRAPLTLGVVAPWRDIGLDPARTEAELAELTGLDVRSGDHVAAVAATEFFHRRQGTPGVTLYVYARDTIGFAVAVERGGESGTTSSVEISRVGSLGHFPTGSDVWCHCGRTGCLEVTAGPDPTHLYDAGPDAHPELAVRARRLGEVAAAVRDMIAPDRVVLVGQGFTGCPAVLGEVTEAFATGALTEVPFSFTRFSSGIQAVAACTVALGPVYDDPFTVVPRGTRRSDVTA